MPARDADTISTNLPVNAGQDPRLFAGEVSDLILG
jgi:hypothetical protein